MRGAGRLLAAGGILFVYGPFLEADVRDRAEQSGVRSKPQEPRSRPGGFATSVAVIALAARHGLVLRERIAMPANNLALVFRRAASSVTEV